VVIFLPLAWCGMEPACSDLVEITVERFWFLGLGGCLVGCGTVVYSYGVWLHHRVCWLRKTPDVAERCSCGICRARWCGTSAGMPRSVRVVPPVLTCGASLHLRRSSACLLVVLHLIVPFTSAPPPPYTHPTPLPYPPPTPAPHTRTGELRIATFHLSSPLRGGGLMDLRCCLRRQYALHNLAAINNAHKRYPRAPAVKRRQRPAATTRRTTVVQNRRRANMGIYLAAHVA
jgi:hypothetical protein